MYIRFITRGHGKCGPYLYKSVRKGSSVTGVYIGPYAGDLHSAGISIGRTLESYTPPKRFNTAKKIYESTRKRKYPLTVIEDEHGLLKEPYNAAVDTRIGVAIVSKNMAVPERVKAELEEAMHMEGHGERTAEKAAIRLMKKRWRGLPKDEFQRLRGRDDRGRPYLSMRKEHGYHSAKSEPRYVLMGRYSKIPKEELAVMNIGNKVIIGSSHQDMKDEGIRKRMWHEDDARNALRSRYIDQKSSHAEHAQQFVDRQGYKIPTPKQAIVFWGKKEDILGKKFSDFMLQSHGWSDKLKASPDTVVGIGYASNKIERLGTLGDIVGEEIIEAKKKASK